ncbi:HD-GYP domain-containing protein [Paenibacillus assamensis]|uniref:HD-GYP domain-containing protein n=1 Tax=Paenibacillus assamensis TaxID=311244 RepID=UPI00048EA298|nr:HD-GYP domain-containing protein [Paenibacillus assamensis]
MRVLVNDLQAGDILQHDVFNQHGVHVLSAGTVLRERDIGILIGHLIDDIDIIASTPYNSPQEQQTHTPTTRDAQLNSTHSISSSSNDINSYEKLFPYYQDAVKSTNLLFHYALTNGRLVQEAVDLTITPLLEQFQQERDVVSLLLRLNSQDDYTCQHSVQVGMLSYYLATWLGHTKEDALRIGKAGYLHDIGKCQVDREILNKPAPLTQEEYEQMKLHPLAGYQIIRSTYDDKWIAIAALQHHERTDGSGYPEGLTSENIHMVAKIVSVADVYSAMISCRTYQDKKDLLIVLKQMYQLSFSKLDPVITHTFIRYMLPNFLHKRVKLTDGRDGIIVMNHATDFFRPLIRVGQEFIDLTVNRDLDIDYVYA